MSSQNNICFRCFWVILDDFRALIYRADHLALRLILLAQDKLKIGFDISLGIGFYDFFVHDKISKYQGKYLLGRSNK